MSPKDTAYIVERLAVRFMSMVADYERKLVEHRDAFGARTSADAKIIEGMRAEIATLTALKRKHASVIDVGEALLKERYALREEVAAYRAEVAALQERLRASIARGDFAEIEVARLKAQAPKRSHPVKVGEWVKNSDGGVARVLEVHKDWYLIARGHGWTFANCEPCDPPADHDTPAGKASALVAHPVSRYADTEPELDQPTEVERAETELNRAQWADRYERKESADDVRKVPQ